jgi:hypothetical protein
VSNITVSNDAGICGAVVTYTAPAGADNCSGATVALTSGIGSGGTFPAGTTTETYTVTDAAGNTAQTSFTVTVNDTEAPTISAPANITVANDSGMCGAVVNYTPPAGTDNCSGATTTLTSGIGSGGTFPIGTTTETYTVTDAAGNTATASFDVIVSDNEAPVIVCPSSITVANDPGQCSAVVTFNAPTGTDNCVGATTTQTTGLPSGSSFPVGTITNTFETIDAAGNSTICQFSVTVTDAETPVITCSNDVTSCSGVITGLAPSAADNCVNGMSITYNLTGATTGSGTNDASGTFNIGATVVQYIATDGGGNADTCSFTVTVFSAPVINASASSTTVCVNDGPVTLTATPTGGTWAGVGVTGTMFNPSVAGVGPSTLTYAVTDANGCSNTFDLVITVNACVNITEQNPLSGISIYPNPTDGAFTINVASDNVPELKMEIIDLQGRVVYSEMMNGITAGFTKQMDVSAVANGAYYLRFTSANSTLTEKLMIQK